MALVPALLLMTSGCDATGDVEADVLVMTSPSSPGMTKCAGEISGCGSSGLDETMVRCADDDDGGDVLHGDDKPRVTPETCSHVT